MKEPKNQKKTTDHLGKEFPSVSEMCRCWGITRSTYNARIKSGYSKEKALTQPVIQVETAPKKCKDHLGQEFPSQNAMCRYWGTNKDTLKNRMEDLGWSLEKALTTNGVIVPGIGVSDYMGRTFPTITDMCHFYGFLLHDLQGTGCSEKAFLRAVKRRYRKKYGVRGDYHQKAAHIPVLYGTIQRTGICMDIGTDSGILSQQQVPSPAHTEIKASGYPDY